MKKIKSHVFKQVSKQRTSLKGGQGMKALGAHLYTNFPSVPPPTPQISCHICCEVCSRLIKAMCVTSLGCLCTKPASFEIFLICLYVCM